MWKKYYTMTKISKAIFDRHPDWRDKFWQFVRFGVVGTISSAIHYGVYCLVLLVANANISFTAGYAVGFICNYFLSTITEKAGEEGDKYLSLSFVQYKTPSKKYVAVVTPVATVAQPQTPQPANPAVEQGKTYTVQKGDTLWKIAKQFYGNGSRHPKIVSANSDKIKNPNLIYPGQTFSIPS